MVGDSSQATVECPAGSVVTGGGYQLFSAPNANLETALILASGEFGNGWVVNARRSTMPPDPDDVTFRATAVCTSTS